MSMDLSLQRLFKDDSNNEVTASLEFTIRDKALNSKLPNSSLRPSSNSSPSSKKVRKGNKGRPQASKKTIASPNTQSSQSVDDDTNLEEYFSLINGNGQFMYVINSCCAQWCVYVCMS